jgi:hypothetical protein
MSFNNVSLAYTSLIYPEDLKVIFFPFFSVLLIFLFCFVSVISSDPSWSVWSILGFFSVWLFLSATILPWIDDWAYCHVEKHPAPAKKCPLSYVPGIWGDISDVWRSGIRTVCTESVWSTCSHWTIQHISPSPSPESWCSHSPFSSISFYSGEKLNLH